MATWAVWRQEGRIHGVEHVTWLGRFARAAAEKSACSQHVQLDKNLCRRIGSRDNLQENPVCIG